ncbi:MAG: ParA family protein [Hyphomicrobiaceae bacterium]
MRNAIAVMNTKGGVGKSTILLAIAETLAVFHGKRVLVIDSDAQSSISSMLMATTQLYQLQSTNRTIVDFLIGAVLEQTITDWRSFVVSGVSDVDDATGIHLFPSDVQLTLFEREVSRESLHGMLRSAIAALLHDARHAFDVVLIDCPPGLSVLTESWLREADYHITPTKADYISTCALEVFRRFKALDPHMGFAQNLGVVVNMFDPTSPQDAAYLKWLQQTADNHCFASVIPRMNLLQDAARRQLETRSYSAKYPGEAGRAIKQLTAEVLARLAAEEPSP